ncbi:hypothetical protein K9L63_00305 [Candidatus Gracilibacteria bacterium]|nr:hypothetical protein [Candidatus Gracilibacteria bacterium]
MFRNFFLTFLVLLLSGSIFYTSLTSLDPLGPQSFIALFTFFISIFFGIASFGTFVCFFGSEIVRGKKLGTPVFFVALRRGIFLALFVTVLLGLQLFRLLGVFEAVLFGLFLLLVEFIFLSSFQK